MNFNNKILPLNTLTKIKHNPESNQSKKGSIFSNQANTFSIPALNQMDPKQNSIMSTKLEDFNHLEEKFNFQKTLDKLRSRKEDKFIKKNEDKSLDDPHLNDRSMSSSKINSNKASPLLKRCLSYRNDIKKITPTKRKSEALFEENVSIQDGNKDKISFNIKRICFPQNKIPVPITTNNNFNITITNVNNNIVLPDGQAINYNFLTQNSANTETVSPEIFSKNFPEDNNLLSPATLRKKEKMKNKKENEKIEMRGSLNNFSGNKSIENPKIEIIKKQPSIQTKNSNYVRSPTKQSDVKSTTSVPGKFAKEIYSPTKEEITIDYANDSSKKSVNYFI